MALVMLPCEFPWWSTVKNHLDKMCKTKNTIELIEGMRQIHDLCNISLDPDDEESTDPELFIELLNFLDNEMNSEERSKFLNKTLPNIINRAVSLKKWKPRGGLHFSLQQQPDSAELEYNFVSSLIANAFFSTFPKRTNKSHPTLQDFNFTNFFKHLDTNMQKAKFKSLIHYFDWLDSNDNSLGSIKVTRQVMSSKEWLTIEDWLECTLPLCQLQIRHEGRLDKSQDDSLLVCFCSADIGGSVLSNGSSQESVSFVTCPEILSLLLHAESLEDNEVLTIERARHISKITDPKNKGRVEKLETPLQVSVCCIDAENYTKLPISQYEEDNVLRELNKCLLAFRQNYTKPIVPNDGEHQQQQQQQYCKKRRLTPIGESIGSSHEPSDVKVPIITQLSCSTNNSESRLIPNCDSKNAENNKLNANVDTTLYFKKPSHREGVLNNRRGKFIVLGSSGECLPVKRIERPSLLESVYSSSSDEYHSAKSSLDGSDEEDHCRPNNFEKLFAQNIAKRANSKITSSSESSQCSSVGDHLIRQRRKGSTGFILQDDYSFDNAVDNEQEHQWREKFKLKHSVMNRKDSKSSGDYSFSTEFSSELEEVYEQFSKWLHDPILETDKESKRVLDQRDLAVVQFAGSLLKRTLSESFAGVSLEGCESISNCIGNNFKKEKMVLNARSLSLELAKHKHKLAAQLLKQIAEKPKSKLKVVSTGNWGCGSSKKGEVQLKVIIQWLAASVAGVPSLIYYTSNHQQLAMMDTVYRILRDRKWTVKDLATASLRYAHQLLMGKSSGTSLFEDLIGVEKSI